MKALSSEEAVSYLLDHSQIIEDAKAVKRAKKKKSTTTTTTTTTTAAASKRSAAATTKADGSRV